MIDAQRKMIRIHQNMIKMLYLILQFGASLGLGYFGAQSNLMQEISPFSLILLTCSTGMGLMPTGCYIGSTFGYLMRPFDLYLFKYITALTMIYVIYIVFGQSLRILRGDMAITAASCCFVSGFLFLLVGRLTLFNVLLLIAESVLICCSIFFVSYAVKGFKRNCRLTSRELIAAAVSLILIMISLHNVSIFQMSVARILGLFIIFLGIHSLKTSHAAVLGSCIGIILAAVANGGEAIFTAIVAGTLMGCVFSNFSDRFAELSILLIYYAVLISFGKFPWNYWLFAEPMAAYAVAFFVPKEKLRDFLASYITVKRIRPNKGANKGKIEEMVAACKDECGAFCPKAPSCYQKNKDLLAEGLEELLERYQRFDEMEDIEHFLPFCSKPHSMKEIVSKQLIKANAEGFNEITNQIEKLSKKLEEQMEAAESNVHYLFDQEEELKKTLQKRNIAVKEINFISDAHQKRRCEIKFDYYEDLLYEKIFKEVLAPHFPRGFAIQLKLSDGFGLLKAVETERFSVSCAAICRAKDGEALCGDKAIGFSAADGIYYLLLSDGMGSGKEAALQSETAISTLQKLLASGMVVKNAVSLLRSAMRFRQNTGFATLDICRIDLKSGIADFYKMGAFDSFCIMKDQITRIKGGGMPQGLLSKDCMKHFSLNITDGTTLIMASDGFSVLDEQLEQILYESLGGDVRESARRIHKSVVNASSGMDDDISFIIAKLAQTER